MTAAPALLCALLLAPLAAAAQPAFLSLSDIHFDPYYDPTLMNQLVAADASGWAAIFAGSQITSPSAYGSDTNYPLLRSMLGDAGHRAAQARFVVVTGDFLSHDFEQNFRAYAPDKSPAAFQSFTTKTIQFLALQLQQTFPGAAIYPVIGNNDSDCGDYNVTPDGWFLAAFAAAFAPSSHSRSFDAQVASGGYYRIDRAADMVVIGINSIFFSPKFTNPCGTTSGNDYGARQLKWLAAELAAAKRRGKHVWLLYHIPPGIDAYKTISGGGSCPVTPALFWESGYTATFDALLQQYASTIAVSIAGHTHMDDFRVLYDASAAPSNAVRIAPSVSPMFENNPAYAIVDYSRRSAAVLDYAVYSLPLTSKTPQWSREYAFGKAYGQKAYNAATLAAVRTAIQSSASTRSLYMLYYAVSSPHGGVTASTWKAYWCATGAQTGAAFQSCYCPPS
ncbi:MAG TPA: hypothetical protein VF824_15885 [Thermoanaerobaculia bacterium]|jgi:3',5'-cyclic AMP phosphodiesterase CpdA